MPPPATKARPYRRGGADPGRAGRPRGAATAADRRHCRQPLRPAGDDLHHVFGLAHRVRRAAGIDAVADACDYESYLSRLAAYPAYNRAQIAVTRSGVAAGYAQPCEPLRGFETSITTHIVAAPEQSVFWKPFAGSRPAFPTAAEWSALQDRARGLIVGSVIPAYRELLAYYTTEYAPRCRASVGISDTPAARTFTPIARAP